MALSKRKEAILQIIIEEYIASAFPIASKNIASNFNLNVSPATIRNDIADLAEEGYVRRSHLSAGAIPTDKGYRYYVESIDLRNKLSRREQRQLQHLLSGTSGEIEQIIQLVATYLAHLVHNVAIVSSPKVLPSRFKHVDLVSLHDFIVLIILVLGKSLIIKRIVTFSKKHTQDELSTMANKLNALYEDRSCSDITNLNVRLTPEEHIITASIVDIIEQENKHECNKPYLEGLHLMFNQPEFTASDQIVRLIELLEEEVWWEKLLSPDLYGGSIRVIIGGENNDQAWQDLSLIIRDYGIPDIAQGFIGVIGPKRIDYGKAISSIDLLSKLLSNSIAEYI